jgi:hypothetical protein
MHWWQFALYGAGGGAIVEVLTLFNAFATWQRARTSAAGTVLDQPPQLGIYVDFPAHAWMLPLRAVLGAISAAVFAAGGQLKGAYVAVALGFCGPALLTRLGELSRVEELVNGSLLAPASSGGSNGHHATTSADPPMGRLPVRTEGMQEGAVSER